MKNILIISALAGVLALSSCRRDDLYYATVDRATAVSYTHLTLPTKA